MLQHPAYVPVADVRGLPRVLLIGDSISIGYTVAVRRALKGMANVHRPLENCRSTVKGVESLERWVGVGKWDVIHFNFGLHDSVRVKDELVVPLDRYEANLRSIAARLKATGARLIWATTTPVPLVTSVPNEDMRYLDEEIQGYWPEDIAEYNRAAGKVMSEYGVETVDLYSYILPMQASVQLRDDIHFTKAGYAALAGQVARAIREELQVVRSETGRSALTTSHSGS